MISHSRSSFLYAVAIVICLSVIAKGEAGPVEQAGTDLAKARSACLNEVKAKRYSQAWPACQATLVALEESLGRQHEQVGLWLGVVGTILTQLRDPIAAESAFRRCLMIIEKAYGPEDSKVALALIGLGRVLRWQGRYRETEAVFRRTVKIRKKLPGAESSDLIEALYNLGETYEEWHRFVDAESNFQQIVRLTNLVHGSNHAQFGWALHRLAFLYLQSRRFGEAASMFRRSLSVLEGTLGVNSSELAMAWVNLAAVYDSQQRLSEAEALYLRSLRLLEKFHANEHRNIALVISNIAFLYKKEDRLVEAENMYRRSLYLLEDAFGKDDPDVGTTVGNMAFLFIKQGRYEEAEYYLFRLLKIRKKRLGINHPEVTRVRENIATFYLQRGEIETGIELVEDILRRRTKQVRDAQGAIAVQSALDLGRTAEAVLVGLVLTPNAPPAIRELLLASTILRKGLVLDAAARFHRRLLSKTDGALQQRAMDWLALRQRREALLLLGREGQSSEIYQQQLQSLGVEEQALESQLATDLLDLGATQDPDIDHVLQQVSARLPKDGVLVEVVLTQPFQRGQEELWGAPRYVALLLFPDRRIVPIDLGEAAVVDRLVRTLLGVLSSPSTNPATAAQSLYRQALAPLFAQLGDQRHVYLSLDGMLNLIPFDALHDGHDDLLGRYRFHYLSSGRDLLRVPASQTPAVPLVLGNPLFGGAAGSVGPARTANLYQQLQGLSPLPGTQREVEAIAKLLGVSAKTQHAAREDVLHAARAPRILHIATHGLFLPTEALLGSDGPQEGRPADGQSAQSRSNIIAVPFPDRPPPMLGPMHRAALVFSDVANVLPRKLPDGHHSRAVDGHQWRAGVGAGG